jgi:hypothetical protein
MPTSSQVVHGDSTRRSAESGVRPESRLARFTAVVGIPRHVVSFLAVKLASLE